MSARHPEVVVGILEPPIDPVDRPALIELLRQTRLILSQVSTPIGGIYRRGLIEQIDAALLREANTPAKPALSVALRRPWPGPVEQRR